VKKIQIHVIDANRTVRTVSERLLKRTNSRNRRRARQGDKAVSRMFAGFLSVSLLPSLIPSTPVSWRHPEKQRLLEKKWKQNGAT